MGAMQTLQWAAAYPERVFAALPIAGAARHSAQNIAFHEVGRQAVMADPDWKGGVYFQDGSFPRRGLAVARMAAHITYLSDTALHRKFGRQLQDRAAITFGFDADFQVESYLRHQGRSSSSASTPTAISTSRARWIIRSRRRSRRHARACIQEHQDALLPRLVHVRLAVSDRGSAPDRACTKCRERFGFLRRDRDRQRPRRFSAG